MDIKRRKYEDFISSVSKPVPRIERNITEDIADCAYERIEAKKPTSIQEELLQLIDEFGPINRYNILELAAGNTALSICTKDTLIFNLMSLCREKKVSRKVTENQFVVYYIDKIDEMEFDI